MDDIDTLASFEGGTNRNGPEGPSGGLIADASGNLYGVAGYAGPSDDGSVYEIAKTATGYSTTPITVATFNGSNGSGPAGSLVSDASGNLYGTTSGGGASDDGTLFEIAKTPTGYSSTPTTLVTFNASDYGPAATLTIDSSGNLYGSTEGGGQNDGGAIFELTKTANGYSTSPTTIATFNRDTPAGGLHADASGNLYGVSSGDASVFEIAKTATGYNPTPITLYTQGDGSDGSPVEPNPDLITDPFGNLYGTSFEGGATDNGTVFEIAKTATGFSPTPTVIVSFDGNPGFQPAPGLVADAAGDLYGVTDDVGGEFGYTKDYGTVFEITKTASGYSGTPTTLGIFDGTNGSYPAGGLITDSLGNLYGATDGGGANDGGTVFEVTASVVCFCAGSLISTDRGDVVVEALAVGDRVITASGAHRPIKWLGHRTIHCRRDASVRPIRIAAGAFGASRPARDLFVSPGHAICVDIFGEVLIPAGALVNGSTIQQVEVDKVIFWHVELDSHDILLAENLPCESYLEMGNRAFFAEAETIGLHARPDASIVTHADFCRPYVDGGPRLEVVRAMLHDRQARLQTQSAA